MGYSAIKNPPACGFRFESRLYCWYRNARISM